MTSKTYTVANMIRNSTCRLSVNSSIMRNFHPEIRFWRSSKERMSLGHMILGSKLYVITSKKAKRLSSRSNRARRARRSFDSKNMRDCMVRTWNKGRMISDTKITKSKAFHKKSRNSPKTLLAQIKIGTISQTALKRALIRFWEMSFQKVPTEKSWQVHVDA